MGRPPGLVALAVGGIPLRYTQAQAAALAQIDATGPTVGRVNGVRVNPRDWYGPPGTWDERLLDCRDALGAATPSGEFLDARGCPALLPPVLKEVSVPIQFAVAEYEDTAALGDTLLEVAHTAAGGTKATEMMTVVGSGHNLSLGFAARSYHLRVLAHGELGRASAASSSWPEQAASEPNGMGEGRA